MTLNNLYFAALIFWDVYEPNKLFKLKKPIIKMSKDFDINYSASQKQIKLISQDSNKVTLLIAGTGTMTIDWGDGMCEKHTLLAHDIDNDINWVNVYDSYPRWHENEIKTLNYGYRHVYTNTAIHTITLIGDYITHLCCDDNQVTNLDSSNNIALTFLSCNGNELSTLDVSKNVALTELQCSSNFLTSLDLSNNAALKDLSCCDNKLTNLDVGKNTTLLFLICENNQLTNLEGIRKTKLMWGKVLYCRNNQFSADVLNYLFDRLPYDRDKSSCMYIDGNPGTNSCNCNIAKKRGWRVELEPSKPDNLLNVSTVLDNSLATEFNQITLTLQPGSIEATIQIIGTGTATIDWGDRVCETYMITKVSDNEDYSWRDEYDYNSHFYSHKYGYSYYNKTVYTITIIGENIVGLCCEKKRIKELDVSRNATLETLYCGSNHLKSLDISNNKALKDLHCPENQISNLNVNGAVLLQRLICSNNQLTHLDVSGNTALRTLYCQSNQLTNLDVSKNAALLELDCSENQLTSLDVSGAVSLSELDCVKNQLTYLDVRNNTRLQSLSCSNCQLTYLDISNDSNLQTVCCPNNQLSTDALDDLFGLLPFEKQINKALYAILQRNPGMVLNYNSDHTWNKKTLYVSVRGNPGAESCDRIIAQNKGWIIK